jgi:hypothetical protein
VLELCCEAHSGLERVRHLEVSLMDITGIDARRLSLPTSPALFGGKLGAGYNERSLARSPLLRVQASAGVSTGRCYIWRRRGYSGRRDIVGVCIGTRSMVPIKLGLCRVYDPNTDKVIIAQVVERFRRSSFPPVV